MCGDAFATLYTSYEAEGRFVKRVKARELWYAILDAQMETGKCHNYDPLHYIIHKSVHY